MKEGPHRSTLSPHPFPLRCCSYSYPSGARVLVTHGLGLTTSLRRESRFLLPSLWLFFIMKVDVLLLDSLLQKALTLAAFSFRALSIRVKIHLRIKCEAEIVNALARKKNIHTREHRYFICK